MRHFFLLLCSFLAIQQYASAIPEIKTADDITEEWLISSGTETGYTEHVSHFKRLFESMEVRTLLEFGCGFSSKYFMDHSQKVVSVEFVTNGTGPDWIKYCMNLFKDQKNWNPIVYFSGYNLDSSWTKNKYMGVESVYQAAAYQPVHRKSYALIDPSYLTDLNKFIKHQTTINPVDVAFVDCGICIRGDLVQLLFNKVPIIVAHDIGSKTQRQPNDSNDVYGYGRIIVPPNYEEIHVPFGMGTCFWVKKENQYLKVLQNLKEYVGDVQ